MEELRSEKAFPIGLLYGPSGCGKSSLVQAGLLPRLSPQVQAVFVESTADETESRLLAALRAQCPTLPHDRSLVDFVKMIRNGYGPPAGNKVLIVLDQFEQWLHAHATDPAGTLVQAMRQCDGARVQTLILVRDDFWMAATGFMREVEVRISEGQNAAAVDLFPIRHAINVLDAYGRAFGTLPKPPEKLSADQQAFLRRAAEDLAQDGKVICVRLALFAEIMKSRPWTLESLRQVGGAQGVGLKFLEGTFDGPSAPLSYRYHEKAARMALRQLLPKAGQSIRGHTRSRDELNLASGYATGSKDFSELMTILDTEVRLITPCDTLTSRPDEKVADHDATADHKESGDHRFQLTHDYLVHSLRTWLTQKQRETRLGRAELLLSERASLWASKPENRHLPTLGEDLRIRWLTDRKRWTGDEQRMMSRARHVHGFRVAGIALMVVLLAIGGIGFRQYLHNQTMAWRAKTIVDGLVSVEITEFDNALGGLSTVRRWARPILVERLAETEQDNHQRLRYSIAALGDDPNQEDYLVERLPMLDIDEFPVARDALRNRVDASDAIWQVALDQTRPDSQRFQAACALVSYDPDDPRLDQIETLIMTCLTEDDSVVPSFQLMKRIEHLSPWRDTMVPKLRQLFADPETSDLTRERVALALATYLADQPTDILDVVLQCRRRTEFIPLLARIEAYMPDLAENIQAIITADLSEDIDEEYEDRDHRVAIAAAIMAKYGDIKPFTDLFRAPSIDRAWNPSLWSLAKHFASELLIDHKSVFALIENPATHDELKRELIEILGRCGRRGLSQSEVDAIVNTLTPMYTEHPDSGVHQTCYWALTRLGKTPPVVPAKLPESKVSQRAKLEALNPRYREVKFALDAAVSQASTYRQNWEQRVKAKASADPLLDDPSLRLRISFLGSGEFTLQTDAEERESIERQLRDIKIVGGVRQSSAEFDGERTIDLGDAFQPERDQPFSYGCWVYNRDAESWAGVLSRFDTGNGEWSDHLGSEHRGFDLWLDGDRYSAHLANSEPDNSIKVKMVESHKLDVWNHVFVTYDGSSKASGLRIFVDGELRRTEVIADSLTETITTSAPLLVGSRYRRYPFNGWLDDIRFYDRELSGSDVRSIYESAVGSILQRPVDKRSPEQSGVLDRAYRTPVQPLQAELQRMRKEALGGVWEDRRRWFVNGQDQEFVVLPSVFAKDGDNAVDYDFAIGIYPVTAEQFAQSGIKTDIDFETIQSSRSPADRMTWFQVAEYCNWLSDREGIPDDQWCFAPNEDGNYDSGMMLKPNFRELQGYRIPTAQEWFYAGRCHAGTRYFFGAPSDFADGYSWYASNALGMLRDVGFFPPNGFGIFDIHGNVWEFPLKLNGVGKDGKITHQCQGQLLGGAINNGVSVISFEGITTPCGPGFSNHNYGFRLAKSVPLEEK